MTGRRPTDVRQRTAGSLTGYRWLAALILALPLLVSACSPGESSGEFGAGSDGPDEPALGAAATLQPATDAPVTPTDLPTATRELQSPTSTPTMEPTPTDEPTPTEEPISTEAPPPAEAPQPFADVVDQLLAERTGFYAVVISSPLEGLNYELNSGEPLQAASLYKLAVMVEIFRQREEGMLSFDDTVVLHPGYFAEAYFDAFDEAYLGAQVTIADLITPMITVSSNVAGWALLDLAGTENVNATMLSLGLTSTEIRWTPGIASQPVIRLAYTEGADQALNVTSAADMAMLFQMLLDGAVVSPQASNEMLEILKAQGINHFLSALLPPAVAVAHKTGSVDDVLHDTGIIYTPSGPVVVVVLTEGADAGEATEFMQQLGALVYAYAS